MRAGWRAVVFAMLVVAAGRGAAVGSTSCAVLAEARGDGSAAVAVLVEQELARSSELVLVDRSRLEEIIEEQTLSAAFSSQGVQARVQLGKLIGADLLVILRERKAQPKQERPVQRAGAGGGERQIAIEMVVAESRRGLRLAHATQIWDADGIEGIANHFAQRVLEARARGQRHAGKVFAVPPFESQDLMAEHAGKRQAFAELVEEYLLGVPDLLVVELSEAQALAREVAVSGENIDRALPYYLMGRYQSEGRADAATFQLNLELRHGQETLACSQGERIAAAQVGQELRKLVQELLDNSPIGWGSQGPLRAPEVEVKVLLDRADVFRSLVEWDAAIPLFESALLLDSKHESARLRLFEGYMFLALFGGQTLTSGPSDGILGRLRYGELAFECASAMLMDGQWNQELLRRLSVLTVRFHLSGYASRPDYAEIEAEYGRILNALADDVFAALRKPLPAGMDKRQLDESLRQLGWFVAAVPKRAPLEQDRRLEEMLMLMDGHGASVESLFSAAVRRVEIGPPLLPLYMGMLDRLGRHESQRLGDLAMLCRLLTQSVDEQSFDNSMSQVRAYAESRPFGPSLVNTFESKAREFMMKHVRKRGYQLSQSRAACAADAGPVPKLTLLSDSWTCSRLHAEQSQEKYVCDWINCGPGVELLVFSRGLYRLGEGDELTLLADVVPVPRRHMTPQALWDGKYVWICVEEPRGAIVVVDPGRGEIARFSEDEVLQGSNPGEGRLACTRPGQALFFGTLNAPPDPLRNWATVLEVEAAGGRGVRTRFTTIYESRETQTIRGNASRSPAEAAGRPYWAMRTTAGGDAKLAVMVATTKGTLIFDLGAGNRSPGAGILALQPPPGVAGRFPRAQRAHGRLEAEIEAVLVGPSRPCVAGRHRLG